MFGSWLGWSLREERVGEKWARESAGEEAPAYMLKGGGNAIPGVLIGCFARKVECVCGIIFGFEVHACLFSEVNQTKGGSGQGFCSRSIS